MYPLKINAAPLKAINNLLFFVLISFFASLAFCPAVQAQNLVRYELPGSNGTTTLDLPWVGGLENPQFSFIDLNNDGTDDLFIFDKGGNKTLTFEYNTAAGGASYLYAPEYEDNFPEMVAWALMEDYNCDGITDLFTHSNAGVVMYEGSFASGELSFVIDTNRLLYDEAGFFRSIEISEFDIPEIVDVDGDGDLDVLTFNPSGGYVEYFQNRASSNGDPCGMLDFELVDECWGDFYESGLSTKVSLYSSCKGGRPGDTESPDGQTTTLRDGGGVHAGSALMCFDEDFDGDLEMVLGDLSFDNLGYVHNGGDATTALMTGQDTLFPSYDVPYLLPRFPAAFYQDMDHDGRGDMVVAPNSEPLGAGRRNVWYYRDIGTDTVNFNLQTDSFLVGDMFDLGTGCSPAFFDHNGDGLMDIVAGNHEGNSGTGSLSLFENIGSATDPEFKLITMDYFGVSIYGFSNLQPDFGDLDDDGDMDMLVGEEEGKMHFFVNNPVGGVASFALAGPNYMGMDAGMAAAPELIDIDRDGDLDLLVGERNGNLNYYENTGSAATPMFASTPDADQFGGVWIAEGQFNVGYIVPRIWEDGLGEYVLYVGHDNGRIFKYNSLEDDLTDTFDLVTTNVSGLDVGWRAAIDVTDLNGDGRIDFVVGNQRGGMTIYADVLDTVSVGINAPDFDKAFQLYPNPATTFVAAELVGVNCHDCLLSMYDLTGKERYQSEYLGDLHRIDISNLETGLYMVQLWSPTVGVNSTRKLMINR